MDLDKFKDINDTFGHLVGDEVLKKVALTIQNAIRETDFIGRYGGEEFMIILSTDSIQEAVTITERIRKDVEELVWVHDGLNTSVSIGLVYSRTTHGDKLLKEADKQLYAAKEKGRNRLVFSVI